jgi:SAM-dependent methyltransferase
MQKVVNYYESTYSSKQVLDWYNKLDFLFPSERVLFKNLAERINGKKILDIGIGGGRTTNYFAKLNCDYTGIDYMEGFARSVSEKHPQLNIKQYDARNMSMFADATFDFILFSFNGIDNMDQEGRLQILKEIHRVLKHDGIFMFSTHNRDHKYFNKMPWQEKWRLELNYIKLCLAVLKNYFRHLKMKKHNYHCQEYSIVNDYAHDFRVLTYYISGVKQKTQLERIGFKNTEIYDLTGKKCDVNQKDGWMYYLTYKQ